MPFLQQKTLPPCSSVSTVARHPCKNNALCSAHIPLENRRRFQRRLLVGVLYNKMETVRGLLPAIRDAIASGSSSVSSLISQAKIACLDFPSQKAADPFQLASSEEQSLTRA